MTPDTTGEEVSTHASVRRRHGGRNEFGAAVRVSTHASVRRRLLEIRKNGTSLVFQLTPP